MAKGYIYAEVEVTDPELYAGYQPKAAAAIAAFGGRYLVRGGDPQVVEGDRPPKRAVILEFDSPERAREFYHSPQYQEALAIRQKASTAHLVMLNGTHAA